MLDVRIPMGILFVVLGALLYFYGWFVSEPVLFYTPDTRFPLKLNMPVGAFMFMFGVIMLVLARYIRIHTMDRELANREKELGKADRKRQKALAKRELAAGGQVDGSQSDSATEDSDEDKNESTDGEDEQETGGDASVPGDTSVSGEPKESGDSGKSE